MSLKVKKNQWHLTQLKKQLDPVVEDTIHSQGKLMLRESKTIIPVDTGRMRRSSGVRRGRGVGSFRVTINFYQWYAVRQHENDWYHHDVGESGWLSKTLDRREESYQSTVRSKIKGVLGNG